MRGDVAVLFAPSLRAAWEAWRVRRRVGVAADARAWLLTDVVAPGRHRRDTYAALAAAVGATADGAPRWTGRSTDRAPDVPLGHVALVPVSPSGAPVAWGGYAALAARLPRPVVWYAGPGEGAQLARVAGSGAQQVGLPLPAFAAALARASVVVANDSGAAHFARAVGVPTVVVHGSTSPARTGAAGAIAVEGPDLPCRPCYRKTCRFGLECLDVPVERVLDALAEAIRG